MGRNWVVVVVVLFMLVALTGVVFAEKHSTREWKKLAGNLKVALNRSAARETAADLIQQVGQDNSKRALDFLIECAIEVEHRSLYLRIKRAIASMTDEKAQKAIKRYIRKHPDMRVRIVLIEAVGRKGNEEFIDAIAAILKSKKKGHMSLTCTAIEALAKIGSKKSLNCLIEYLDKIEKQRKKSPSMGRDWHECRIALTCMTNGEVDYETAADWKNYTESLEDDWKPIDPDDVPKSIRVGKMSTVVLPDDVPKLFGRAVTSRAPVFVIDVSGTMSEKDLPEKGKPQQPAGVAVGRQRLIRAQKELKKLIRALDDGVEFNIIAYGRDVISWSNGLEAATSKNKKLAQSFVDSFDAVTTTHTDDALEKAWESVADGCDTIYLLSDGYPTHTGNHSDTGMLQEEILSFFRSDNRFAKVKIYTLGFKYANRRFLISLARENHGEYKDIK